jgi:sensor domain CHASE-containing protein
MTVDARHASGGTTRAWLFALLGALLVLAAGQVVAYYAQESELEQERSDVLHRLSTVRARLEGLVNVNLSLVHGLTAVIESRPDIDQAGFAAIADGLVDKRYALRNIGAAPDLVLSLMYPLKGNEAALGLDYRQHPVQREAALRARDSGRTVIAGPLSLEQGGVAIIARKPVFLPAAEAGGEKRFWGLVSAAIDVETLYEQAGLRDSEVVNFLSLGQ